MLYKKILTTVAASFLLFSATPLNLVYAGNDTENSSSTTTTQVNDGTDIVSGVSGTSNWRIDSTGVLHIEAGTVGLFTTINQPGAPWLPYRDVINKVILEGRVVSNRPDNMFYDLYNVKSIENLEYLDISGATNLESMFAGMSSLEELDVSSFDTSNITRMTYTFARLKSLKKLDLSNWDTERVRSVFAAFSGMEKLEELNLSSFNTASVSSSATFLFEESNQLKILTLGSNFSFPKSSVLHDIVEIDGYTGKWRNIGEGTVEKPLGDFILTSSELMVQYEGSIMADTYVWEPVIRELNVHDSTIYV